jgi:hypothetical protein
MHTLLGVCLTTAALSTASLTMSGVTPATLARTETRTTAAEPMPRTSANRRSARIAVTYVLMSDLRRPRLVAAVRREPHSPVRDLVVLKSNALTPELLVIATKNLGRSVRTNGVDPKTTVTVFINEGRHFPTLSANERAWAEGIISQLRAANVRDIPTLGQQQALTVPVDLSEGELKPE